MLQELFYYLLDVAMADFVSISCWLAIMTIQLFHLGSLDRWNFLKKEKNQPCNELSSSVRTLADKHPAEAFSGNVPHIVICISQLSYKHLPQT